jgi:uncharacterized protein (TIGR02453 family)
MPTFQGWPIQAFTWFEGLQEDNSKEYFTAHRSTYDQAVKGPLLALLEELEDEFGPAKMFRPNRDVRFSHDKSPYKTNAAAVAPGDMHRPGFWVEVSAEGIAAGAGFHGAGRTEIDRFRAAVADEVSGSALEQVVADLAAAGMEIHGETLKSAPRGYPRDHPRIRLLRHTHLIAVRREPPGALAQSPKAAGWVRDTWRTCQPMVSWLRDHV